MTKRNPDGTFAKGNRGGPGRPPRAVEVAKELHYLGVIMEEVGDDEWRAVVRKAVEDAKDGDRVVREWLTAHLIASDLKQIEKWREAFEADQELTRALSGM